MGRTVQCWQHMAQLMKHSEVVGVIGELLSGIVVINSRTRPQSRYTRSPTRFCAHAFRIGRRDVVVKHNTDILKYIHRSSADLAHLNTLSNFAVGYFLWVPDSIVKSGAARNARWVGWQPLLRAVMGDPFLSDRKHSVALICPT